MSLFIRVNANYFTHPKTLRLRMALGHGSDMFPIRLWAFASQYQPDGDLSKYSADELAMHAGCLTDATSMLQALIQIGFIDQDPLRIHDWQEYNGYHSRYAERAKVAATARWAKKRTKRKRVHREEIEKRQALHKHALSIPLVKPSLSEVTEFCLSIDVPKSDAESLYYKWEGNNWTNGSKPIKDWKATIRSWKAARYLPSQKQNRSPNGDRVAFRHGMENP